MGTASKPEGGYPGSPSAQREATIKEMEKMLEQPPPYTVDSSANSGGPSSSTSNGDNGPTESQRAPVLENLDFEPSPLELPTAGQCIAHLKLLHAFAGLRKEIGNQEGIYGIQTGGKAGQEGESSSSSDNHQQQPAGIHEQESAGPQTTNEDAIPTNDVSNDQALEERLREKRWTVFVTKAVNRFEKWWAALESPAGQPLSDLRTVNFDYDSRTFQNSPYRIYKGKGYTLGKGEIPLPPLDVLLVWHAYMLNPRGYFEDCIRLSKDFLWQTIFPWETIYNSIDNETYVYTRNEATTDTFFNMTNCPWDFRQDNSPKQIDCPKCSRRTAVPWTNPPQSTATKALDDYLSHDDGFCGKSFNYTCLCGLAITHEKLRVGKFIEDVWQLQDYQRPMPGTILNSMGLPQITSEKKAVSNHEPFFPNRVLEEEGKFFHAKMRRDVENWDINKLKLEFQRVMKDNSKLMRINSQQFKPTKIAKESAIAVRKMLSNYWDNSSVFGLDLVGAVIRQSSFVQKMVKINWVRSPAAVATMQRLIVKYHRFVRIIGENPKKIAVPTLDVDLAWHTHQLTPRDYLSYTLAECEKFLNHDDKIAETSLNDYFQWTTTVYEKKYGQPYSECACWYCECTREPLRSSFSNRFSLLRSSKTNAIASTSDPLLPKDAATGIHISAHNAVIQFKNLPNQDSQAAWAKQRRKELENLDLQYAKVCKRYQKKKKADEAPRRDNSDAYYYSAYGYPMPMPMVVPYYAAPTDDGNRYSTAQASGGGGGGSCGGGCAAGTCAESTSVGNCAGGVGTPYCQASCGGHGSAGGGCGTCTSGGDGGGGGGDGGGGGCGGGGD
ncbi:hypothetical protein BU24DRAFT_401985 [Aaosphaeria arxii CBS 175.79]|uniref:Glycine-rich domain-containing protein n=1 Tax=Aaosphaeria arxii CBS 175.79 TaxID=1450172 RepID=A0A6A5X8H9_9PLEO|nr:uncharacterized protein BU24DRAFT_401985 [Aaosphaeria arxii CBS 175.79]KAF2009252.1 hypothetical protein BU24DRAFT_401985 [Aaosphaeria arxii CBS 175.79]